MSETRIFQTETRSRREVSTSRETENETRREIKQFFISLLELLLNADIRIKPQQTSLSSNWRDNIFTLQEKRERETDEFRLGLCVCLTKIFWATSRTIASNIIFTSRSSSRENLLHLVSHEKFHFSRETRTRRDLAHG
jgi:hypothetical protein